MRLLLVATSIVAVIGCGPPLPEQDDPADTSGDSPTDTADTGADTADTGADTADTGADTADTGADPADTGSDTADTDEDTDDTDDGPPLSFALDVLPELSSCLPCHVASTSGGLNFSNGAADLRDQPSSVAGLDYATPGDVGNSYFWRKIDGSHADVGGSGGQMPSGGAPLPSSTIDLVADWILDGAAD